MKKFYNVFLFFENGKSDVARVSTNTLPNLEGKLKNTQWLQCEENKTFFNMNRVLHFHLEEIN